MRFGKALPMPHDEIAVMKVLQARGLRVTSQRLLVLDAICDGRGHTSAGDIIRRVREADASIDQSTVHRTLDLFTKLGLVSVSLAGSERLYEIVGEVPHHHLVCSACGKETELPRDTIDAFFARLDAEHGFTVTAKHVILEGACAACRQKA
jgi:Fur family transcriptional regulator, ferric uptake regulator